MATPSLVARVLNSKYTNVIPLYRQEQEFAGNDVNISRQTMANRVIKTAERYLSLVYDHMKEERIKSPVLHADETPVMVTKDGREGMHKNYMWVYRSGSRCKAKQVVLYEYRKTGKADAPQEFLEGFKGKLVCDGYQVYHTLENRDDTPLVDSFFEWCHSSIDRVLPSSKTAGGIKYCINQEKYLRVLLEDSQISLDSNLAEQAIRLFCAGKKNWKLIDTVHGAQASTIIYSIVETAKANDLNIYQYFKHLLTEIPKHMDDTALTFINAMLPWSKQLPAECRKKKIKSK